MKIKIITICIIAACALVIVPLAPSVESAMIHKVNNAYILAQIKTIDPSMLKEKLQNYDINEYPLPTIKKLIEILNTDFNIVLPGIIIRILFYLGFIMQMISIGPFLNVLGVYLDFFAMVLIEIIHGLGMEI